MSDHEERNREHWNRWAADYAEPGRRNWASEEETWGIWHIPEAQVGALPPSVAGMDVVELGCGTAYWSAWLARRGAAPVGVDLSEAQLATARELQAEHSLSFPLLHASAEDVPLPDASFDLAFSEYGASIWCRPRAWLSEAARLLRPGGRLIFLTNSPLLMACTPLDEGPTTERLARPLFGMERFDWADDGSTEFHLPHGVLIDLLGELGFAVERLLELQAPADGDPGRYDFVTAEWATAWPSEEIWIARRRG